MKDINQIGRFKPSSASTKELHAVDYFMTPKESLIRNTFVKGHNVNGNFC